MCTLDSLAASAVFAQDATPEQPASNGEPFRAASQRRFFPRPPGEVPGTERREIAMEIDKSQIIELLKSRGDHAKAGQAEADLPDKVDTDKDSGLLQKYGLNPQDLMSKLPGGLGGLGG
jgi:hypothetical protein